MSSYFTTSCLYFLSCVPGVGLFTFVSVRSLQGDFSEASGAFAFMAVAVGSFSLIILGIFFATGIYIVFESGKTNRPKLFIQFADVFDIKGLFKHLISNTRKA